MPHAGAPGAGSSNRGDLVAQADDAVAHNVGPQPARAVERGAHTGPGHLLEVRARWAVAHADHHDFADGELPADQCFEVDALGDEVAAGAPPAPPRAPRRGPLASFPPRPPTLPAPPPPRPAPPPTPGRARRPAAQYPATRRSHRGTPHACTRRPTASIVMRERPSSTSPCTTPNCA